MGLTQLAGTLAAILATCAPGSAQQITFIHESSGSGILGGVPFSTSNFTITSEATVANRQFFGSGWLVDHDAAEIEIEGLGTFSFVTPTRTFVNNTSSLVGFSRVFGNGTDLLSGPTAPVFATWDMLTGVPATTGPANLIQWSVASVQTTGGVLAFNLATTSTTFTATLCDNVGNAYCFGDGSGAVCPCAAFGGPGEGCANSSGGGATLTATGGACLLIDTLEFEVTGVPGAKPSLLLRGDNPIASLVGDGLLCTAGGSQRSQVQVTVAGATTFTDFGGQPFGAVANVGAPTNFQCWYRDPEGACTGAGFNFSNAWTVTYQP